MATIERSGVIVSFGSSLAEQTRAARRIVRASWAWWLAMSCFVAFPLCFAAFVYLRLGWVRPVTQLVAVALAGALGWEVGIPFVGVLSARRSFPGLKAEHTWTLQDDGCIVATPRITTHLQWDAIVRVRETSEFFLFYISSAAAHFLPKRVLDARQMQSVRDLLKRAGKA